MTKFDFNTVMNDLFGVFSDYDIPFQTIRISMALEANEFDAIEEIEFDHNLVMPTLQKEGEIDDTKWEIQVTREPRQEDFY